jgi:hypothetical protein
MEGETEAPPKQSSFDIDGDNLTVVEPTAEQAETEDIVPKKEGQQNKSLPTESKKPNENYRPYCGEGHGKMIPSKFGGFWCPHCRS